VNGPETSLDGKEMSTLQEIKSAIANLSPHDKALLTAELP